MNPNQAISQLHLSLPLTFGYYPANTTSNISRLPFLKHYEVPLNDISTELIKNCSSMQKQSLNDQQDVTERQMVIDKMQTTLWKLGSKDLLYTAVYLMDLIIDRHSKESKAIVRLEEVAMGSLFLSIKFNQYCDRIPPMRTIQMVFDPNSFYSKNQLKMLELFCIKHTSYNLSQCSSFTALEFIILRGIIFPSDLLRESFKIVQLKLVTYSREILKKIVKKSNEYIQYNQLHLALGIICYSRQKKQLSKWNDGFEVLYDLTLEKISKAYQFIQKALSEKRQLTMSNCYYIEKSSKTKTSAKVKASSSIKDMHQMTQYQTSTIESYRKKSQRSTSASLDETILMKKIKMKSLQRQLRQERGQKPSVSYRKSKNNSTLFNELNSKHMQGMSDEESYRKDYNETISIRETAHKKDTINTSINNSMLLNQTIQPAYQKLCLVLDKKKPLKMITSRIQTKKHNLSRLLFEIECKRKIDSSKDKPIKKTFKEAISKRKEQGVSLKKIKEAWQTAQTQRKAKKKLTSCLTLIDVISAKKDVKDKAAQRKGFNER